jgi:hypothetical protein
MNQLPPEDEEEENSISVDVQMTTSKEEIKDFEVKQTKA